MRRSAKSIATTILALSLFAMPLSACGQRTGTDAPADEAPVATSEETTSRFDASNLKTLADVLSLETGNMTSTWDESHYISCFIVDGTPIRTIANITPEQYLQISDLDFSDSNYDQNLLDIIGSTPLASVEDLSDTALTQDEISALVGKTGQELLDAGFEFYGFDMVGEIGTRANMDKGPLRYSVEFNENLDADVDMDDVNLVKDLTIKSVELSDFSNAALDPTEV